MYYDSDDNDSDDNDKDSDSDDNDWMIVTMIMIRDMLRSLNM